MIVREVIRNHQHSSKIVLSKCISKQETFYEKSSYTFEGINELKSEVEGYRWYLSKAKLDYKIDINCDIEGYCNIRIPGFNGVPCPGTPDIANCFKYAIRAIDHYHMIWSDCDVDVLQPIHGDFSLEGNILFNQSDVYIIDWEHFRLNIAPLGFDLLYMIFELIKMHFKTNQPTNKHLSLAKDLIFYADSKHCLSSFYKENYFLTYLDEQERINNVWGDQYYKLPTTQFNKSQIRFISKYFDQYNQFTNFE